jgi:uncharacterized membrane protein YedE/YeeE
VPGRPFVGHIDEGIHFEAVAGILEMLSRPWPWYVAGPLIGLIVPALLLLGNKPFGISSNLRHACAAVAPCGIAHFRYDWKKEGAWNLAFAAGILAGGMAGGLLLRSPEPIALAARTKADLAALGLHDLSGLVPSELFNWASLLTARGLVILLGGGFLVGFGTAYAGGCTSGHAITGLADRQLPSLLAVCGFFAGGLAGTWLLLPLLL